MQAQIVIVGGGIAGLATAWQLAQRGVTDVLLLEGAPTLASHSTAKNAAILRSSIGNPIEDELAAEGAQFLLHPPTGFASGPLIDATGLCLVASGSRAAELAPWLERARAQGHDLRDLDAKAFAALAPHFKKPIERALYSPGEGRIELERLIAGYIRGARLAGVRLLTDTRVAELWVDPAHDPDPCVRGVLLTDGTRIEAQRVALAAGGWAAALGARAGSDVRLQPTRRHLAVTAKDERVDPRWPIVWSLDGAFYARPEQGGLMLCACDETDVDPDLCHAEAAELERIRERAAEHLGALAEAPTARFWAGMRTFSDDRRFLIGPDAKVGGLFWIAGLGGHGIVCGAAVGRRAADWLCAPTPNSGQTPALPSAPDAVGAALDPRRFGPGAPGAPGASGTSSPARP